MLASKRADPAQGCREASMIADELLRVNEQVAVALGYSVERRPEGVAQVYADNRRLLCCPYNPNMPLPKEAFFSPATDLTFAMSLFAAHPFVRLEKVDAGYLAVMRVQDDPCYYIMGTGPSIQLAICKALIAAGKRPD